MVQLDSIAQSCSQGMYMNLLLFYQHVHVLLMCFHSFMGMGLLQSKNPRSALSPVSSGCPAEEETPESRVGEGAAAGRTQLPDGSSGSLNRGIHASTSGVPCVAMTSLGIQTCNDEIRND